MKIMSPSNTPSPWQREGNPYHLKLIHGPEFDRSPASTLPGWPLAPSFSRCCSLGFWHTQQIPAGYQRGQKCQPKTHRSKQKTWRFAHPAITSKWSWPETVRKAGTLKNRFFSADSCVSFDVCKSKTHKLDYRFISKDPSSQLIPFFPPKKWYQSQPEHS